MDTYTDAATFIHHANVEKGLKAGSLPQICMSLDQLKTRPQKI